MPLTTDEKARVRYHLGYPAVSSAASIQFGVPALTQTNFLVENVLDKLLESACDNVRRIIGAMDGIETRLLDAQDRLAAIELEDLKLREDETDKLEGEYRRWGYRLSDLTGAPIYAYSRRYAGGGGNMVTNIPVRG